MISLKNVQKVSPVGVEARISIILSAGEEEELGGPKHRHRQQLA